jgi:hypothetical protein
MAEAVSYAQAAGGGKGATGEPGNGPAQQRKKSRGRQNRPPATRGTGHYMPVFSVPELLGHTVLIDWKLARPNSNKGEIIDYVLTEMRMPVEMIIFLLGFQHTLRLFYFICH